MGKRDELLYETNENERLIDKKGRKVKEFCVTGRNILSGINRIFSTKFNYVSS